MKKKINKLLKKKKTMLERKHVTSLGKRIAKLRKKSWKRKNMYIRNINLHLYQEC